MNGIGASLSGILAGQARLQVAASNVAGASSPRYRPLRMDLASAPGGGVSASVRSDTKDGVSLSDQAVEMLRAKHEVGVNAAVVRRLDDMHGSLIDILA